MYIVQSVLNHLKNINPSIKAYVLSLVLANGRKNCAAMARLVDISEKKLYHFLAESTINSQEIEKYLLSLASITRLKTVLRALVVDPTAIIKHYAEKIEKLCHDRAGCTKKVEKGLVPVYAAVIDVNVTIPLNLEFWVQEKIIGKKLYKSKVEIAQALVTIAKMKQVSFDFVALDGAFSVTKMFTFFAENKDLKFIMRIAKSRVITTEDGLTTQLKHHPAIKLHRNEREKTVTAKLKNNNQTYFLTAQKRSTRGGGWETVFLISNMDLPAKEQVAAYNLRLPIEKMIRTTKQKFGATQCQTVQQQKQTAHILAGFLAYAILNIEQNDKQAQSVDVLVNKVRELHTDELIASIRNDNQLPRHQKVHSVVNVSQNNIQIEPEFIDQINVVNP